jgi:quercetin dioxygenase-like cupin family protein
VVAGNAKIERRAAMSDASCFHNLHEGGILRELAPGISARVFPGVNAMLSVVTLEPHSVSPVHAHANEQWGVCLEGEWIRIQDGVEHHVKKGDFWQTPPNVPHGGRTLDSRCVVLDIFAPPREEYRQAGRGLGAATLSR